jgi:hypothetical protein
MGVSQATMTKRFTFFQVLLVGAVLYGCGHQADANHGRCTQDNCVDFGTPVGRVDLIYGANEDDAWHLFTDNEQYQQFHRDVGSAVIRVWLSAQPYRPSTFPLRPDGTYDWANVDRVIDAVLKVGAIPDVTFAHGDRCAEREEYSKPFDFSECAGHGSVPPTSTEAFTAYVDTVVRHFKERCKAKAYSRSCDPNQWYFEVWNEPSGDMWWGDDGDEHGHMKVDPEGYYYTLFNATQKTIKAVLAKAKVIGYGKRVPESGYKADYRVGHLYANLEAGDRGSVAEKLATVRGQFAKYSQQDPPLINGEYHFDWGNVKILSSPEAAIWTAAALINMIEQRYHMELFYSGTSLGKGEGYGMWGRDGHKWPLYHMKRQFTANHPTGSQRFAVRFAAMPFDMLATGDGENRYLTVVNKGEEPQRIDLQLLGSDAGRLVDSESGQAYTIANHRVTVFLAGPSVRFFRLAK